MIEAVWKNFKRRHHGHGLSEVGLVIGFHVGSMYLPSLITGILVDKIGRTAMAVASGVTLLLAGIVAAVAPTDSMIVLIVAHEYGYLLRNQLEGNGVDSEVQLKVDNQIKLFLSDLPKEYENSKEFSNQFRAAEEHIKPLLHLNY